MSQRRVTIAGAGIFGLWQALMLARAGHKVRVLERVPVPFAGTASQYAGAMIAPYCEAESAEPIVRDLGLHAAKLWKEMYPGLVENGTLVVASARDQVELRRFQRLTVGYRQVAEQEIGALEADLGGRFQSGLFFADEAHMATPEAMEICSRWRGVMVRCFILVSGGMVMPQRTATLSSIAVGWGLKTIWRGFAVFAANGCWCGPMRFSWRDLCGFSIRDIRFTWCHGRMGDF